LVGLAVALFGCGDGSSGGSGGDSGGMIDVALGAVLPISGPNASVGKEMADAAQMAVDEWSARFAEQGFDLRFYLQDDASDAKQAVSAAYAVTGDPAVFGLVAHYNSGCFLPAANIYARANTMAISPATTNVEITRKGLVQIARVTPHDGVQGELTAAFVKNHLKLTKIAIIHDKTQYGQGLAEVFRDHGKTLGLEIQSFDGIQVGDKDFKALLTKLRQAAPEAVYFGGLYDEAGFLVRQMRELQMTATFISDDGSFGQDFFDVGGDATEGAILSFPGTPLDKLASAQDFMKAFEAKYDRKVQNYGPYAYDTANILLASAFKAAEAGIKNLSELRTAVVANARAIEHPGAIGTTRFDDHGDTLNQQYSFYRVEKKDWVFLGTAMRGGAIVTAEELDAKAAEAEATADAKAMEAAKAMKASEVTEPIVGGDDPPTEAPPADGTPSSDAPE
jgi:branched-chain amino acid transport system substrate-binding protein